MDAKLIMHHPPKQPFVPSASTREWQPRPLLELEYRVWLEVLSSFQAEQSHAPSLQLLSALPVA